ncbi:hypothetical protein ABT154_17740 [Streptomyces sp. NPDC001728]|uniref:hypothetical protein n=1 Tax=Streptomyces sp. NPDC001728 TaxID=3154396 RepID=UPI00333212D6
MPVDPFAVLQALLRAEASRAQRPERPAPEPATPDLVSDPVSAQVQAPTSEPSPVPASPAPPTRREGGVR